MQYCHKRLSVLHNYFDSLTKLFSDLYTAKFLDTTVKLFCPCNLEEGNSFSHLPSFPLRFYRFLLFSSGDIIRGKRSLGLVSFRFSVSVFVGARANTPTRARESSIAFQNAERETSLEHVRKSQLYEVIPLSFPLLRCTYWQSRLII